jgi:gluconolactonase
VDKVASGFGFTEEPVWSHSGSLLTDINAAVINKWTPGGKVVRFLGPAEFPHRDSAVAGVPGANGLTLDNHGRLVICDQGNRVIARLEKSGKIIVLADGHQGERFNSPNDLVFKSDGSLYFTRPPYGLDKEDKDPKKEQPVNGVYRLVEGKVELLVKDLTRPNGLAFSPDEKYLYISNSEPLKRYMRYSVDPEGHLGPGEIFFDITASTESGLPDGMKADRNGNLYAAGPGGVLILSPEGTT